MKRISCLFALIAGAFPIYSQSLVIYDWGWARYSNGIPYEGTGTYGPLIIESGGVLSASYDGREPPPGGIFTLTPTPGSRIYTPAWSIDGFSHRTGTDPGPLARDEAGNIYVFNQTGGPLVSCGGSVFMNLVPIHYFPCMPTKRDVSNPSGRPLIDANGNVYGVAQGAGANDQGGIFEISPDGSGGWTEQIIYSFPPAVGNTTTGPGGLAMDAQGNLYGVSPGQSIFELSHGNGVWDISTIYTFTQTGHDCFPNGFLTLDAEGNIYGTTQGSTCPSLSPPYLGEVFELSQVQGFWTETILHQFNPYGDAANPNGPLVFDASGNLYGTACSGGEHASGAVFKLTPNGSGGWDESGYYAFPGGNGGTCPYGGVVFDPSGTLYGQAEGGLSGLGIVYAVVAH